MAASTTVTSGSAKAAWRSSARARGETGRPARSAPLPA
jgi:hypothetical protein